MENLKKYENVIIINGSYTEEEYTKALDRVKDYISNYVEIKNIEEIGIKRLAYEVQNQKVGYYVIFEVETISENVKDVERFYRINDDILKFLFVRKDD
ncbi:MAG: 30S ribosomal protein S6 [Clostridia bacterium]|jgi:small subunit ribosomal protein S6|nr:30S ribosomal protein S6 [Clostridia bacterium]